jgi:hypothetical protein
VQAERKEIQDEKEVAAEPKREVSDVLETLKQMNADDASQATAAQRLGDSANVAKTKAEAAYTRVCICYMNSPPSINGHAGCRSRVDAVSLYRVI